MVKSDLWVEKYRPESLSEIPIKSTVIENLEGFVRGGSLPHMLFAGPPGSGRTMTALAVARDLLGEEYEQNFLKISCSDEGVLERRKTLPGEGGGEIQRAKRRASGSGSNKRLRLRREFLRHVESPPIGAVPHKILYLMDFDQEDSKAQNSLRRPMENYSDNCRFILAASDTSNIISALKSRCAILKFGRLPEGGIRDLIWGIGEKEEINITKGGVNAILRVSRGNLHRAINLLQAASALGDKVDEDTVYRASSAARPKEVGNMVKLAFNGKFEETREKLFDLQIEKNIEPETLLKQIQEEIPKLDVPEPAKIKLVQKMGDFDFDLIRGANPRIQIERVLTHLSRIGNRLKS